MMLLKALHTAVPGRARFKVAGLYRCPELRDCIRGCLAADEGVGWFSLSILTGNLLIVVSNGRTTAEIACQVEGAVARFRAGNPHRRHPDPFSKQPDPGKWRTAAQLPLLRDAVIPKRVPGRGKMRRMVVRAADQEIRPWHLLAAENLLAETGTDRETGLTDTAVQASARRYGPNVLPEAVPRSRWSIFMGQFNSLPVGLLGVAAVVSAATGGLADAAIIMSVVLINAAIGYVTESQSEKIIYSLKNLVRPSALVRREGQLREIGAEQVVPGDLLVLRPGSYIAADARLLETRHLSIDESALTGESMPVTKHPGVLTREELPLADRNNMVYMGTLVTGGQGLALVVASARYTELGRIQLLVGEARPPETPMEKQLERAGRQLVLVSLAVCGLVFLVGLMRGYGLLQMLKVSISLAIAAVPEGLPAVATTTLSIGIRRMQRHHALIRHLDAVETLGSVQTICMDKTGTLTFNRMSVVGLHAGGEYLEVRDGRLIGSAGEQNPYQRDDLLKLIHVLVLCNESEVFRKNGEFVVTGSPTENALIDMAMRFGVDVPALREQFPLQTIQHRSDTRNYMVTEHGRVAAGEKLVAVKGSPLEVLANCRWVLREGSQAPLTDEDRQRIERGNEDMAGDSLRVLGVACAWSGDGEAVEAEPSMCCGGLVWLGLVGMKDPIRPRMKDLIDQFHQAGIKTVMITGDQAPTAFAIGRELNLSRGEPLETLEATHLSEVNPELLKALSEKVHVFSRVNPAHKLQIVQALQQTGRVVAMTGDGINDGPALKAADVGIAMGHAGTDVAREVADVVLEDDNLETMIIAVSQGRTIYSNIRKTVHYLLATNFSEIMTMVAMTAAGVGQPLTTMQLLWINLISDIFPGLALAMEAPEPDVLSRPPRDPQEPIIQAKHYRRIAFEAGTLTAGALGAYGYGLLRYGAGAQAGTLAFLSLSTGQILHALACRSTERTIFARSGKAEGLPPNPYLRLAIGCTLALQGAALFIPGLRNLLGITAIRPVDALAIGAGAVAPLFINEATKRSAVP
jgi:Ca2+-transporting ATPase